MSWWPYPDAAAVNLVTPLIFYGISRIPINMKTVSLSNRTHKKIAENLAKAVEKEKLSKAKVSNDLPKVSNDDKETPTLNDLEAELARMIDATDKKIDPAKDGGSLVEAEGIALLDMGDSSAKELKKGDEEKGVSSEDRIAEAEDLDISTSVENPHQAIKKVVEEYLSNSAGTIQQLAATSHSVSSILVNMIIAYTIGDDDEGIDPYGLTASALGGQFIGIISVILIRSCLLHKIHDASYVLRNIGVALNVIYAEPDTKKLIKELEDIIDNKVDHAGFGEIMEDVAVEIGGRIEGTVAE